MEACVVLPRQMCLQLSDGPSDGAGGGGGGESAPPPRLVTASSIAKGTTFTPLSGTLRTARLTPLPPLLPSDVRNNWGSYDRLREQLLSSAPNRLALIWECNWVRFLRVTPHYTPEVNMVGVLNTHNTITFSVTRSLPPDEEIVAFTLHPDDLPQHPSKSPLLPHPLLVSHSAHYLEQPTVSKEAGPVTNKGPASSQPGGERSEVSEAPRLMIAAAMYRQAVASFMIDAPLDLSQPLIAGKQKMFKSVPEQPFRSSGSSFYSFNGSDALIEPFRDSVGRAHQAFMQPADQRVGEGSGALFRLSLRRFTRERSVLSCQVCGKVFDRPSLLKRHMRTHTGEKPHVCDVCGKGFSTSSSLNTHRRIHSGEKPHQCATCGKRFTASSNLYYHKMTHIKDKPHKCGMCCRSFPTPGDLRCHSFIHTGQWPHRCPVCGKGFSKLTNQRTHLLLHQGMTTKKQESAAGTGHNHLQATAPLHSITTASLEDQWGWKSSLPKDASHNIGNHAHCSWLSSVT